MDFSKAVISANIPLNKLQNAEFHNFLQLYTHKDVPFETTHRQFRLDHFYKEMMKNIRQQIFSKKKFRYKLIKPLMLRENILLILLKELQKKIEQVEYFIKYHRIR